MDAMFQIYQSIDRALRTVDPKNRAIVKGRRGTYAFTRYYQTPCFLTVPIKPVGKAAKDFMTDKITEQIKLELGLDGGLHVVAENSKGVVCYQIPMPPPVGKMPVLPVKTLGRVHGYQVPIGVDSFSKPVWLSVDRQSQPHIAFNGGMGSGKSVSVTAYAHGVVSANDAKRTKFIFIDVVKGCEDFKIFGSDAHDGYIPHLLNPPIKELGEALAVMNWIQNEFITKKAYPFDLFLVVDEVGQSCKDSPEFAKLLHNIVTSGRDAGVHVLAVTQLTDKASVSTDGASVFRHIGSTIIGKVKNAKVASDILGKGHADIAGKLLGSGDLYSNTESFQGRFFGGWVRVADFKALQRNPTCPTLNVSDFTNHAAVDTPDYESALLVDMLHNGTSGYTQNKAKAGVGHGVDWNKYQRHLLLASGMEENMNERGLQIC